MVATAGCREPKAFVVIASRAAVEYRGFAETPSVLENHCKVVENFRYFKVLAPEYLFCQRECAPIEALCVGISSLNPVKSCQAVQHLNMQAIYVLRATGALYDAERPYVKAFCVGIAILLLISGTECVDDVGNVGVVGSKLGFEDLERLQAKRTSARMFSLRAKAGRLFVELDG